MLDCGRDGLKRMKLRTRHLLCTFGVWAICSVPVASQELVPRAYWPAPKGTKILSVGYAYTDGDVLVDPSTPVKDAENETHSGSLGYYQAFGLAGRSATISAILPAAAARIRADTGAEVVSGTVSGLSDLRVRLGVNLLGAPAMTPAEFREFLQDPPRNLFGVSLQVQVPTGEYNNDRVANVGTSRWSLKPEIGYIRRLGETGSWAAEASLGVWLYDDNDNFLGLRLEQEPMLGAEFHLVHLLPKARWFSVDLNYYAGGRTRLDDVRTDDRQENSRIGATLAFPAGRHVFKVGVSDSLRIEDGGDYRAVLLGWAYIWD